MKTIAEMSDILDIGKGSVLYWIDKLEIKKEFKKIDEGRGTVSILIDDSDFDRIIDARNNMVVNQCRNWISLKSIADAFKMSPIKIGQIASIKGMEVKKVARLTRISPENAAKLKAILNSQIKAVSTGTGRQADNREKGYYHRISPLWMMDAHQ